MKRSVCFWPGLVLAALAVASCAPVVSPTPSSDDSTTESSQSTPGNLKERIDAALDNIHQRDLLTKNSFWTIFHGILGTGPGATLLDEDTGKRINAIDYIANGGQVNGLEFLITPNGLDVRTDPAGLAFKGQGHQDQFIAEMAQWDMPADRKFIIQGREFAFRDFVNHTKMRARVTKDQELSWAIVIIAQYLGTDLEWTNRFGEKLRFEDVVGYEMKQPIESAACGGTHRLFGMTWAYHLYRQNGGKKTGVWKDLVAHLDRYKKAAKEYQNSDFSFSTKYVSGPGTDRGDPDLRINTTGHVLEWLALALTDAELKQPWVEDAANALSLMLLESKASPVDGGSLYHAAHGLHIYRNRVFGVRDPSKPQPKVPPPPKD